MIREALSHLHWSVLPVISMMLFFAVFIGVVIWVNRKESTSVYGVMENLPLDLSPSDLLKGDKKS